MAFSAEDILQRRQRRGNERSTVEAHWQEIIDYMRPDAPSPYNLLHNQGEKNRQQILDSAGEMAGELLAAALHGALTNPATDWMLLRAEDEELNERDDLAIALEDATRKMLLQYRSAASGFATAAHECYLDLVFMGIGHLFIADRRTNSPQPCLFQARPVAEMFIAENAEGKVDTWLRDFRMTARQAAQEPGWTLGKIVADAARDQRRQDEQFRFVQMIAPRRERGYGRADAANMAYADCIVSVEDRVIVYESGFEEAPLVSPRWSKRADETYGRGPGMKALPDVKMLQRIARATIRGAELTINPPLQVPDDGIMSPVRLTSGGLTTVRADMLTGAGSPIRPVVTNAQVDFGMEFIKQVQGRIEMAFYSHLIQINQDYRMTATQVLEISERVMQALGPMLGRIQSELLGPMISRTFNIMARAGLFAFPRWFAGGPIKIEYVSPIVRAQKVNEAQGMLRAIAAGQQLAAGAPELMDIFDLEGTGRRLADLYGQPKSLMRPAEKVAEIRRARQQVTEQQAEVQRLGQMVEIGAGAAKAAKDAGLTAAPGAAPGAAREAA